MVVVEVVLSCLVVVFCGGDNFVVSGVFDEMVFGFLVVGEVSFGVEFTGAIIFEVVVFACDVLRVVCISGLVVIDFSILRDFSIFGVEVTGFIIFKVVVSACFVIRVICLSSVVSSLAVVFCEVGNFVVSSVLNEIAFGLVVVGAVIFGVEFTGAIIFEVIVFACDVLRVVCISGLVVIDFSILRDFSIFGVEVTGFTIFKVVVSAFVVFRVVCLGSVVSTLAVVFCKAGNLVVSSVFDEMTFDFVVVGVVIFGVEFTCAIFSDVVVFACDVLRVVCISRLEVIDFSISRVVVSRNTASFIFA